MIEYLLLDLDNTLYPRSSGLGRSMGERMGEFVARYLSLSDEEADTRRRHGLRRYGTTLKWLIHEHRLIDVEGFIEFVHPTDLDSFLTEDDRLAAQSALAMLDMPAAILTNAPMEHAMRVLEWLGLERRFEHIVDIRANGWVGKPARSAYESALARTGARPEATLFADDVLQYVLPFRDMGGRAVHVADEPAGEPGVTTIGGIAELASIIRPARSR